MKLYWKVVIPVFLLFKEATVKRNHLRRHNQPTVNYIRFTIEYIQYFRDAISIITKIQRIIKIHVNLKVNMKDPKFRIGEKHTYSITFICSTIIPKISKVPLLDVLSNYVDKADIKCLQIQYSKIYRLAVVWRQF